MYKLMFFLYLPLYITCEKSETFQNVTLEWSFGLSNLPAIKHVDSSNNPKDYLPGYHLNVIGEVPTIYKETFKNFENLFLLNVSGTDLLEIEPGAFENLPDLAVIECNNNQLSEIKTGTFANLNVTVLELENNNIRVLEKKAFQNLPKLSQFILKRNNIEEIGREVFDYISLRGMDLSHNSISRLEAGIFEKVSSEHLPGIGVNLENNKLTEIDPEVFKHAKIKMLILAKNQISQLRPGDLNNMPELIFLSLSRNLLKNIADNTFLRKLRAINLSHNQIASISSHAFDGILSLEGVDLSHNQLQRWDPDWFPGAFGTYSILNVAYNYIEEIPDDAFKNYPEIWKIDLSKNRIKNISSGAFNNTEKMKYLLLRDNDIEEWDEMSLVDRNEVIFGIDLRRNRLKCFEGDLKEVFAAVKFVWLEDNPIDGACVEKIEKYKNETEDYKIPEQFEF